MCVSIPPACVIREFIKPGAHSRHSDGQGSSRSQSGILSSSFSRVTQVCLSHQFRSLNQFLFSKLGLFASSPPFVTGRPYALIFNGSVKSSSAVGLAPTAGPILSPDRLPSLYAR